MLKMQWKVFRKGRRRILRMRRPGPRPRPRHPGRAWALPLPPSARIRRRGSIMRRWRGRRTLWMGWLIRRREWSSMSLRTVGVSSEV
ncbi:hypothetical protein BDW74DRAFT_155059 [Aspergillus multicolor]|uniref:uncharacterized protein n=1 Tax=Aspergillus multicolor TaxID=41759 RepID=UPI003CCD859D